MREFGGVYLHFPDGKSDLNARAWPMVPRIGERLQIDEEGFRIADIAWRYAEINGFDCLVADLHLKAE